MKRYLWFMGAVSFDTVKRFLWTMAVIFLILTGVFYRSSIHSVSGLNIEVANIQMTVFAAASAILCWMNVIGALIIAAIDSLSISGTDQSEQEDSQDNPEGTKEDSADNATNQNEGDVIIAKPNEVLFCDNCGVRQNRLTIVNIQTKRGTKQKRLCDKCLAEESNTIKH